MHRALLFLLALHVGALAPDLCAQDSCSFDRCALGFRRTFWSRYLVRGDSAVPVAKIGFVAPALPEFASRQDSVGAYFRAFRTDHTASSWLMLLGAVTLVAGTTWVYGSNYEGIGIGLTVIGAAGFFVGGHRWRRGENALQRGIWLYNRDLPR